MMISDDQTISLRNGRIRLKLSPYVKNQLKSIHQNSIVTKREDRFLYDNYVHRDIRRSSEEDFNSQPAQFLEIDVRTLELEAHIFSMKFGSQRSSLKVINGSLHYGVYNYDQLIGEIVAEKSIGDGTWHRIRIEVSPSGTVVKLKVDDYSKEIDSTANFPQFIFKNLESLQFGHFEKESFFGCLRRLIINDQMQLLYPKTRTLLKQYFDVEIISDISLVQLGCDSNFICTNSEDSKTPRCSMISLTSKTRYILVAGFCIILTAFCILLFLGLIRYQKIQKRRKLAKSTQRVSNLQLISTIGHSSYKNWSYDELDNTEMNEHRFFNGDRFINGHENSAYLSHNSLASNHIYDEALSERIEELRPAKPLPKPMVSNTKYIQIEIQMFYTYFL